MLVQDNSPVLISERIMRHAQVIIEAWRWGGNDELPPQNLGSLDPAAYAKSLTEKPSELTTDSTPCAIENEDTSELG